MVQLSSKTQRLADRFADAIARGRPPAPTPALEAFLAGPIDEIYGVLDAFERHVAAGSERTDLLAEAYLQLLQMRLERLRFDVDADFDWAKEQARAFQHTAAQHAREGRLGGDGLAAIGRALREAKLAPIPELIDAGAEQLDQLSGDERRDPPRAAARMLRTLTEQVGNDPFAICEAIAEGTFTLPREARAAMATFFLHEGGLLGEVAALMILDPDKEVRRHVALALAAHALRLSPASLRRLILLRDWLPEGEHHRVDQIVRGAREAGVECAPVATMPPAEVFASAIDGGGAQGFMIVSPAGRRFRVAALLVKRAKGVRDAWCRGEQSKGEIRRMLRYGAGESALTRVAREYLDLAVCHFLAVGRSAGIVPAPALLQVAEAVGGHAWQPREVEWRAALDALLAEVPPEARSAAGVQRTLDESSMWTGDDFAESWFEEDQEVGTVARRARTRDFARLTEFLLDTIVKYRTEKWAEHFVWLALWHRHSVPAPAPVWIKFAVLADALAAGRDIAAIPLMRDIAARTAYVLKFAARAPATTARRRR